MFLPSGPWFAMVISLIHKLPDRSIRHHGWTSDAKNEIKTHRLTQARNKVQREINKTLVALLVTASAEVFYYLSDKSLSQKVPIASYTTIQITVVISDNLSALSH